MLIAVSLIAAGATANVAGFGVGAVVSGVASVVVFAGDDAVPAFGVGAAESRICTV
jgi:hypothetical protein